MSNIFYAYIPSDEIVDFKRKYYDDIGIIFPDGTLMTREFLPKKKGCKRIMVDFDHMEGWNADLLKQYFEKLPEGIPYFTLAGWAEIWCSYHDYQYRGVEILDRMRVFPGDADYLPDWIPLQKVTVTVKEPFYRIQDQSFSGHPFLRSVKLDPDMQYVGCDSFSNCPELRKVVIGEKAFLNGSASRAFHNDPELSTFIIIPDPDSQLKEQTYPSRDIQHAYGGWWFRNCPKLTELIIADTTRRIRLDRELINK